jgi:hypothetical protein
MVSCAHTAPMVGNLGEPFGGVRISDHRRGPGRPVSLRASRFRHRLGHGGQLFADAGREGADLCAQRVDLVRQQPPSSAW